MQKFISKYALAAHLALMTVAPLVLYPFFAEELVVTGMLWLSLFGATWLVMEPSRRANEMLHDARRRVISEIARDPLFWFLVFLLVFVGFRAFNDGIAMGYNAETSYWFISEPIVKILPGVVKGCGHMPFATLLVATIVIMGCRHALGRGARIAFFFSASTIAGISGLVLVAFLALGAEQLETLGMLGLLDMAGCPQAGASYLGLGYCLNFIFGLLALVGSCNLRWRKSVPLFLFSLGGTSSAAIFFGPQQTLLVFGALALITAVLIVVFACRCLSMAGAFKCVMMLLMTILIPVLMVLWVVKDDMLVRRMSVLRGEGLFPKDYVESRQAVSALTKRVWLTHRWLGTGVGSFELQLRFNASAKDWKAISPGLRQAQNGWWQLLLERGILGVSFAAILLGFLLWTWISRMISACRSGFASDGTPGFFGATDPICWILPFILSAVAVDALYSSSFLRPEVVLAVVSAFALAASSFPLPKKTGGAVVEDNES